MSFDANWIWNAETPARVPAGARISAGKSGRVARSLPSTAVALVKRSPVNCMPSPESPANLTTTRSFSRTVLVTAMSLLDPVVVPLLYSLDRPSQPELPDGTMGDGVVEAADNPARSARPARVPGGQWNECPQAQLPCAMGLSMVNPEASRVSRKSMVAWS